MDGYGKELILDLHECSTGCLSDRFERDTINENLLDDAHPVVLQRVRKYGTRVIKLVSGRECDPCCCGEERPTLPSISMAISRASIFWMRLWRMMASMI